jgi:hypothetical protein
MGCSRKTISQKKIPLNPAVILHLRVYAPEYAPGCAQEFMAECIACLKDAASPELVETAP